MHPRSQFARFLTEIVSTRAVRSERGSAYIYVLMVMLLLSSLGLAVSLITMTEMQIGATDRTLQKVFYSSDSGISLATARALTVADHRPRTYLIAEPESLLNLQHRVEVSAILPILDTPCNLCEINNAGTYSERSFRRINHALTSSSRRESVSARFRAAKTLSAMLEFQPWKASPNAFAALTDPAQLAKIKF